jgi:hypothetical protein
VRNKFRDSFEPFGCPKKVSRVRDQIKWEERGLYGAMKISGMLPDLYS